MYFLNIAIFSLSMFQRKLSGAVEELLHVLAHYDYHISLVNDRTRHTL